MFTWADYSCIICTSPRSWRMEIHRCSWEGWINPDPDPGPDPDPELEGDRAKHIAGKNWQRSSLIVRTRNWDLKPDYWWLHLGDVLDSECTLSFCLPKTKDKGALIIKKPTLFYSLVSLLPRVATHPSYYGIVLYSENIYFPKCPINLCDTINLTENGEY